MKHAWANSLLLVLILVELATGFFGLVSGSADEALFIQAHRVAGYGSLAVIGWKALIIASSLRKPMRLRRAVAPRAASVALLATLAVTLVLGLAWSLAGPFTAGLFSGVSWHIYAGAALVPVLVWYSIHHTRGLPAAFWADRRSFLRLAGAAVAGVALWQASELAAGFGGVRGARRRFTGSYEGPPRNDGGFPVVSWLNDRPPPFDATRWRLTVSGAVEREIAFRHEELAPDSGLTATIDCTGGWYSTQVWRGVPVVQLLRQATPTPDAASVSFTSATGYYRRFSLDEARQYLLATHVGGGSG